MISKKKKISIVIGIFVFVALMVVNISLWQSKPNELQLSIDRTVENAAMGKNINVSEKSEILYLANLFPDCSITTTEGTRPSLTIVRFYSTNASDFLSKIEQSNIREIYYSFESDDTTVKKKYWASPQREICVLKPVMIFEMQEYWYGLPLSQENEYSVKGYNATAITFEKSFLYPNGFLWQVLFTGAIALMAVIAYGITFLALWGLEKFVNLFRRKDKKSL
ncbi:MAG: hypothetical protein WC244_04400 [Patescibacteria group bacterium]|jgi:hypothetical protein